MQGRAVGAAGGGGMCWKDRIVAVRLAVLVKMTKSDFSETEKDIISASFEPIKVKDSFARMRM